MRKEPRQKNQPESERTNLERFLELLRQQDAGESIPAASSVPILAPDVADTWSALPAAFRERGRFPWFLRQQ
jgi:hypothetical protein